MSPHSETNNYIHNNLNFVMGSATSSSKANEKEIYVAKLSKDEIRVQNLSKNLAVARGNDTTLIYRRSDNMNNNLANKNDSYVSFHDDSEVKDIKVFKKPLEHGENIKINKNKNSDYIYFVGSKYSGSN